MKHLVIKKQATNFKNLELTVLWNNPTKAIKSDTFPPENHYEIC